MQTNIPETEKNLKSAKGFVAKYGNALDSCACGLYISITSLSLDFSKQDAALAGKVFGKSGWTRHVTYGGSVNWRKEVLGVLVQIDHAEELELNGSPVPEVLFPILLQDEVRDEEF